jgi:hypothetical protein
MLALSGQCRFADWRDLAWLTSTTFAGDDFHYCRFQGFIKRSHRSAVCRRRRQQLWR